MLGVSEGHQKQELNGLVELNYMNYDTEARTLQEAMVEYCGRRGQVMMMCP